MRPDSFRFAPPPFRVPAELRWTLGRAFGPNLTSRVSLQAPERVFEWATVLGIRERIAARLDANGDRLPAEVVDRFRSAREALVARTLLLQRLLERVVAKAAEIGTSVIALKGIALLESEISTFGDRPLLDLDLLVDVERADDLAAALAGAGMERTGPGEAHHLPPMADPRLGEVELHTSVPGVDLGSSGPTTAADLRAAGLTRASERLEGLELPARPFLAAHAVAHALDQHGLCPTAYPVTRLVADLLDLGDGSDRLLSVEARAWLRDTVTEPELRAVDLLCRSLAAGQPPDDTDAGSLLRHTLVAISSPRYRRSLRRRGALRALRRRQWSKFSSELLRRAGALAGLGL